MLAPAPTRPLTAAVIAFEWELEQIAYKVSEEMLAHIRFAWWREAVDMLKDNACNRAHPVLDALKQQVGKQPAIISALYERIDVQQHAYQHVVDAHAPLDTLESLIPTLQALISLTAPEQAESWARKARKIHALSQKRPLAAPEIRLLLSLLF